MSFKKEERIKILPKENKKKYKTVSVRIRNDIVTDIMDMSERTGYSRNALISILLKYALDCC